mmetsp:Transcript_11631/g.16722  ORF Transcript_11631/g.16722 Transcript_11631/m.16722 type:complete len:264 (+) Transcript_11631:586-1377(+)
MDQGPTRICEDNTYFRTVGSLSRATSEELCHFQPEWNERQIPVNKSPASADRSLSSTSSSFTPVELKQIYIEEINELQDSMLPMASLPMQDYFPLGQDMTASPESTITEPQEDDISAYRRWAATLRGFTPSPTSTDFTQATADPDESVVTTLSSSPILEILPTPSAGISSNSETSGSEAAQHAWHSLGPPPLEAPDESPPEMLHLLYGTRQGLSISPAEYMAEVAERWGHSIRRMKSTRSPFRTRCRRFLLEAYLMWRRRWMY